MKLLLTINGLAGARVYYLRAILHNWDDGKSRVILGHLRDAMTPGYSKILINEWNIPLKGASAFACHSDILMMAVLAAGERTERQWCDLIRSVPGLKISEIWALESEAESILEVVLE